jgi:hypothetical protein
MDIINLSDERRRRKGRRPFDDYDNERLLETYNGTVETLTICQNTLEALLREMTVRGIKRPPPPGYPPSDPRGA